ncbi:MAG: DNA-binding protein [Lachnospiraceae bacterium]|nr:DNA-binding protein [Lachnospiraceae bacterium]
MDKMIEHGLLYDFYGELLTDHQKELYEKAVFEDLSLGEIAADEGISRQGVHDLLKRCNKTLEDYEEKLGLVKRFHKIKEKVGMIHELADEGVPSGDTLEKIRKLADEIVEEL